MYKTFCAIVVIIWILDISNISPSIIPMLEPILNDANGFNGLIWLIIWIALPSTNNSNK